MSNYDGPPTPPSNNDNEDWWQQTRFAVPLAIACTLLLVFLVLGGRASNEPQETATNNSTEQVEEAPAPAPEREPAPEPEPQHDWPSVDAYQADMVDSLESIETLLDYWSGAMTDYGNGHMSDNEFIRLNDAFRETLETHRAHFRGTTPPPGWERAHEGILESWDVLDDAAALLDRGVRNQSVSDIREATNLINEATRLANEAERNIPHGAGERT